MFGRSATTLLAAILLLSLTLTTRGEMKIHNLNEIPYFASIDEITHFFNDANVSIDVLQLKRFSSNNVVLAAYPYSGVDTIDIFAFVKYGKGWMLNTVHFHLRPKHRKLKVTETDTKIVIWDADDEILSLTIDATLNSPNR
jgi:hypothetical protein